MAQTALTISGIPERGFFRCGRHFPHGGVTVQPDEFSDEQWKILMGEPRIRITKAEPQSEVDAEARRSQLQEAIKLLEPDEFGQDGKPKTQALSEKLAALTGNRSEKVTASERDDIWAEMSEQADTTTGSDI